MKGKAYANRKSVDKRPENDFYETPKCLVWELLKLNNELNLKIQNKDVKILDCCCGKYAIVKELQKQEYKNVYGTDLIYGDDFLSENYPKEKYDVIIMNPPFKDFDRFVEKAKTLADEVICIGKLNYFGSHSRNINKLWEHLEWVLPFDRMVAYDREYRQDGKVECGMIVSNWFIWNKQFNGFPKIKVIDVQDYIIKKLDK